jgi:acyl carrier protein
MSLRDWLVFRERFSGDCVLVNGLGATECGLVRQFFIHHAAPVLDGIVPIGYPVEDMEVQVVDQTGLPVQTGQVGEIVVRSEYLALGYYNRPDLTAMGFRPDSSRPGGRTYHTGDLGRLHPDGCLEYLGRGDARVKIHGTWVDLAEVEAVLLGVAGVGEAIARVFPGAADQPRLIGYIVPRDGPAPVASVLRAQVAARLPAAAVPSAFVVLARLPLTENGKLDRTALPPPPSLRPDLDTRFVAPETDMERTIADIWGTVLQMEGVGIHDRFFDLGGDSLQLIQAHARMQAQLGWEIPITALFDHPTIQALARQLVIDPAGGLVGSTDEDGSPRRSPG